MVKIMGFDGSPFEDSITGNRLLQALEAAKDRGGAEICTVRLREIIKSPFHGVISPAQLAEANSYSALPSYLRSELPRQILKADTDHLLPIDVRGLIHSMEEADGFIFATPVWWGMPSDLLKILLSYLTICDSRDYSLKGKVAGFISICQEDGAMLANMLMQNACTHMGMITPPFCSYFFNRQANVSEDNNWQETNHILVGTNVTRMVRILKGEARAPRDWNSTD